MEAMRAELARKHEEIIDLLKKRAISMGRAKHVEEWEKWRDLKRAQEAESHIITPVPAKLIAAEKSSKDSSTLEEDSLQKISGSQNYDEQPIPLVTMTGVNNQMGNIASKNLKEVVNELQIDDVEETHGVFNEYGSNTDCKQPGLSNSEKWKTIGSRHQSHEAGWGLKADQFLEDPRSFIEGFRLSLQCCLPRRIWDPGII